MNVESLLVAVAGLPVLSGIARGVHKDPSSMACNKAISIPFARSVANLHCAPLIADFPLLRTHPFHSPCESDGEIRDASRVGRVLSAGIQFRL